MTLWYHTGNDVSGQPQAEDDAHRNGTEVYIGEVGYYHRVHLR